MHASLHCTHTVYMCNIYEFAHILTPVIALNCVCKSIKVCVHASVLHTDIIETDGPGSLHTLFFSTAHAGHCFALCMRVLLRVCFLPACVCRRSV